eukprot:jgi/Ulvmu1/3083/UM015_0123.1
MEPHSRNGILNSCPAEVLNKVLESGGPRVWAILSCVNKHWKNAAEEFAASKMAAEPRMDRIPLQYRFKETPIMLYRYCMAQTFAIAQSTALQFGNLHCAAILTRGDDCFRDQLGRTRYKLYTWGRGFHGELGKQKQHDEDAAVTRPRSVCLGYSAYNETQEEEIMPVSVSCGAHHTAVITRRGDLITWGMGSCGQTGTGNSGDSAVPKKVWFKDENAAVRIVACAGGGNETIAIDEKGGLWGCGRNQHAQLGLGHADHVFEMQSIKDFAAATSTSLATAHRDSPSAVAVQAGMSHTAFLMSNGALFTCGTSANGRLGTKNAMLAAQAAGTSIDDLAPYSTPQLVESFYPRATLSLNQYVTYVTCGDAHSLAITLAGNLKAWGMNEYGQLGLGDNDDRELPVDVPLENTEGQYGASRAVFVAAGNRHSCVLVSHSGRMAVHSCGYNVYGQLGLGHLQCTARFERVKWFEKQEPSIHVTTVTCGSWHTGAVDEEGNLYTWGRGDWGQLGNGSRFGSKVPQRLHCFTVAHPTNTLHRTNRPKPKLRSKGGHNNPIIDEMVAPTPNPALYVHHQRPRVGSHGPMDKYMRPCTGPAGRLRSASAPATGAAGTQTRMVSGGTSAMNLEHLAHRRKAMRGQCAGMPSRSHSAQVESTSRAGFSSAYPAGPANNGSEQRQGGPPEQSQPCHQTSAGIDEHVAMAENILPQLLHDAQQWPRSTIRAPTSQPGHGPVTRSRTVHNGALQPILPHSNTSVPQAAPHSGLAAEQFADGKGGWQDRRSTRRGMGTSLSADQPVGHRSALAQGRRLRSPCASEHGATACTRHRAEAVAAEFCMDVDSDGDALDQHVSVADIWDSAARGPKEHRMPLRKQNTNVMKTIRSSRQPTPRTRSAGHAYKLRSRSRPQGTCDHDSTQASQCDTH